MTFEIPCVGHEHQFNIKVRDKTTYMRMLRPYGGKKLIWQAFHIETYDGQIIKDCQTLPGDNNA